VIKFVEANYTHAYLAGIDAGDELLAIDGVRGTSTAERSPQRLPTRATPSSLSTRRTPHLSCHFSFLTSAATSDFLWVS